MIWRSQLKQTDLLSPYRVRLVTSCLRSMESEERDLLAAGASEWALAFRFGHLLQLAMPSWVVDAEFNRDGGEVKRVAGGRRFRPDIVIHRRGPAGPNLLMVELKAAHTRADDNATLRRLHTERARRNYAAGLFVRFSEAGVQTAIFV